jgi:dihydrofolate reductase
MAGGTTFHFVTDGIQSALHQAVKAAQGKDIRVGGGVATVQQFLRARLIDDVHLAVAPILLGSGEQLFANLNWVELGYQVAERVATPNATHVILKRK